KKQVVAARRDTLERIAVKEEELIENINGMLKEIQDSLFNRAKHFLDERITSVKTYDEFKKVLRKKGGFIKACWCSNQTCEEKIKEETGATIRLIPFEKEEAFSKCIYCDGEAKEVVYFARAY
ncbi:MAG: proline--tRNA ligase, partial [Candidatus Bathyarchaeota archaeon]